ncbi:MAG: M14 family zinc carboxypeptidase [Flavobacteriales bacterium]
MRTFHGPNLRRACVWAAMIALGGELRAQWLFKGDSSATWEQTIARYLELDAKHSGARLLEIGKDDNGLAIHLFVISDGGGFTPDSVRAVGKNILFINNGIHPGEPDGVDASLLLAQALLESDQYMGLLAKTAVCIVPMYNVSGAGQRGCCSRANQNGPAESGFRGNARNLDLNRDLVKMDALNTEALVGALHRWDPDLFIDTHTTDGADHRYAMNLLLTQDDKLEEPLKVFAQQTLVPGLYNWMDRREILMGPYYEGVNEVPDSGMVGFNDSPRYTTGYTGLFQCIGLMSEAHMLKSFADRVNATFQLQLATLAVMNENAGALHAARIKAKAMAAAPGKFAIAWKLDTAYHEEILFHGYVAGYKPSAVSNLPRLYFDRSSPRDVMVPWQDRYVPALRVVKPAAYVIPQAWREVIEHLGKHGVIIEHLAADTALRVEAYRIGDLETVKQPFEGHYLHSGVEAKSESMSVQFRSGDAIVRMGRNTDRLVMETLEPQAPDSWFAWGFFDSVLQQKEWFSPFVFEDKAAELLEKDAELREAFHAKRAEDPAFAASAWAQLLFIYQRSPYFEPHYRLYPVYRITAQ